LKYLNDKNAGMSLDFLGISPGILTVGLIFLAILLLLIFVIF
jgi:hypothetical protein